jgi:Arc/MetJ-type ribon-helix-helix transcriptional regulator
MALTVRLAPKTERLLDALARRRRLSRSDVVREALAEYGAKGRAAERGATAYDAWMDVLGVVELGVRDPARTTGEQFAAIVQGKTRDRRPR